MATHTGSARAGRAPEPAEPSDAEPQGPQDEAAASLHLGAEELTGIVKRLKRAQGQIGGVVRMIEEGRDCDQIVTQLAAVSKALDRAGFAVIASGLRQCLLQDADSRATSTASLERLFLTLA